MILIFYYDQFDFYIINFDQLSQILTPNRLIPLTLYVKLHVNQSVHVAVDKYDNMTYLLTWRDEKIIFYDVTLANMTRHHIC